MTLPHYLGWPPLIVSAAVHSRFHFSRVTAFEVSAAAAGKFKFLIRAEENISNFPFSWSLNNTLLGEGGQFDNTNFMLSEILDGPSPEYRLFSNKYFWALTSHRNLTPKNFWQFGPWIRIDPSSSLVNQCGDKFWVKWQSWFAVRTSLFTKFW